MTAPNAARDANPDGGTWVMLAHWIHLPAAPAPLDPGNPEHLRPALGVVEAHDREREQREAEQDASDRKLAERIARDAHERERGLTGTPTWGAITQASRRSQIEAALAGIRAGRESGNVCVCGAMRIPADQLSVTVTNTVHRVGGPCYVAGEGEE